MLLPRRLQGVFLFARGAAPPGLPEHLPGKRGPGTLLRGPSAHSLSSEGGDALLKLGNSDRQLALIALLLAAANTVLWLITGTVR